MKLVRERHLLVAVAPEGTEPLTAEEVERTRQEILDERAGWV